MAASFSITRVTAFWGRLNSSFWFLPAVMALLAVALSFVLIEVDALRDVAQTDNPSAIYTFGPEGARTMLSVIASSMITVASLIFSITMLSLQLASSQFGPRTLGNFMRDRGNQIVLGTFIATFSDEIDEDLRGAVVIGRDQTPYQDLEFVIRRIVELAQRSLSPGINGPTSAICCIDRLGQVLGRVADRDIPSPMRLDEGGQLRVLTEVFDLGDVTCRAFAAIARYGMTDADVVTRLVETLAKLETSFPLGARVAVAELREEVLRESGVATVHAFDRKTLLFLQESGGEKP